MKNLNISVANKVATYCQRDGFIVCGNSDYQITFAFDSEWNAHSVKTARFKWNGGYTDIVFSGNDVNVPKITNASQVEIGVFAGDLCTTTPAVIPCVRSILCGEDAPADPTPDVYSQIIELINEGQIQGPQGEPGKDGADGKDGANGKDGADGKDGTNGKSAYEIACDNGFEGTEAEWLDYLNGYTKQIITTDGKIMRVFVGTQAQYEALESNNNLFALITDDPNVKKLNALVEAVAEHEEKLAKIEESGVDASAGTTDLTYTLSDDETSYKCSYGTTTPKNIVIPRFYKGLPVTLVGSFYQMEGITSVTIGNNVTQIQPSAFASCTNLKRVYIPDSVTYIGNYAFKGCSNVTVYCEAEEKPSGWKDQWNMLDDTTNVKVVWGAGAIEVCEAVHSITADHATSADSASVADKANTLANTTRSVSKYNSSTTAYQITELGANTMAVLSFFTDDAADTMDTVVLVRGASSSTYYSTKSARGYYCKWNNASPYSGLITIHKEDDTIIAPNYLSYRII